MISKNAIIAKLDWFDPVLARDGKDSEGVPALFTSGSEIEVWASVPEEVTSNHTD
jgi:hypothetical protein